MFFILQRYYFCKINKLKNNLIYYPMKKMAWLLMCLCVNITLSAQVNDDFSDGNLSANPPWIGDTSDFKINTNNQLQLNASQTGISAVVFSLDSLEVWNQDIEWYFKIKLDFAPSNNNFARIYLLSNVADIKSDSLTGFYLQFGENLAQDAIELFYVENGQTTSVMRGPDAMIANNFDLQVKILKTVENRWSLWIDNSEIGWYRMQVDTFFDKTTEANFAGIYCKYTSSNANKFIFDNIYVGPALIDSICPVLQSCYGNDDFQTVSLVFSEIVDETALSSVHYHIPGIDVSPLICEYIFPDYRQVMLFFPYQFVEDQRYMLQVSGIRDLAGNVMADTTLTFFCHKIKRNDVIISEIMADPTPTVLLPAVEYVELQNRVEGEVRLSGWKLQVGKTLKPLPEILLSQGGFAVVVAENNVAAMRDFCENTVGVSSLSITDGGQDLILYNSYDEVIYAIKFSNDWHRTAVKKEGGWSLEMMDANNPCGNGENWDSSVDDMGGTPGRVNSIATVNPDYESPLLVTATVLDTNKIRVFFSETVSLIHYHPVFSVDRDLQVLSLSMVTPFYNAVDIVFDKSLRKGTVYQLSIIDSVCDCAGNILPLGNMLMFGIDEIPSNNDLIINEILFDSPSNEDADYVEIYNNSSFIIDLKKIKVGNGLGELPEKTAIAQSDGYQLFPQKMVALCKNKQLTYNHYYPLDKKTLLQCDSLPPYANSHGAVHLTDLSLNHLDRFEYDEKMHYKMLTSTDGVSLERVRYECDTQDDQSWKSASANVNFGTPGYENSQMSSALLEKNDLTVQPEIFSPDNDGFDDYTEIFCTFSDLENRLSLSVYTSQGLLVRKLKDNVLCGSEMYSVWDGTDDNGNLVTPGLYVVKVTFWNHQGKRWNKQKVVGVK